MKLSKLQEDFFSSLHDEDFSLCPNLKENTIADSEQRWGVYAYAYRSRIIEAVAGDFDLLIQAYGEEKVHEWIDQALSRYPSSYNSLAEVNASLLKFLEEEQIQRAFDLANFENKQIRKTHYKYVDSFLLDKLPKIKEADLSKVKCLLNPSIELISSYWAGLDIDDPKESSYQKDYLLFSFQHEMDTLLLNEGEKDLLLRFQSGSSLGDLSDLDQSLLLKTIFSWAKKGVLVDVE